MRCHRLFVVAIDFSVSFGPRPKLNKNLKLIFSVVREIVLVYTKQRSKLKIKFGQFWTEESRFGSLATAIALFNMSPLLKTKIT